MKDIVLAADRVCFAGVDAHSPVLQAVDLEAARDEVTTILCADDSVRNALIRVLSFQEPPSSGEMRFQGRVVGRRGKCELKRMRGRVLVLHSADLEQSVSTLTEPDSCPNVVLIDASDAEIHIPCLPLPTLLREFAERGAAVMLFTRDPSMALCTDVVYKWSKGTLQRIGTP